MKGMKSKFFVAVGVVFVLLWFVTLAFFPSALDTFKDFKVEMPALTMACLVFYRLGGGLLLGAMSIATAVLLGLRWRSGWWLTLGMSVLLDVFCLATVMSLVSLTNSLNGGDALMIPLVIMLPFWLPLVFLVNQFVKAALILNRRSFFAR